MESWPIISMEMKKARAVLAKVVSSRDRVFQIQKRFPEISAE